MNFGEYNPVCKRCGLGFGIFLESQIIPNVQVNLRTTEISKPLFDFGSPEEESKNGCPVQILFKYFY